jgi:vancomycin resistance protein YoaR
LLWGVGRVKPAGKRLAQARAGRYCSGVRVWVAFVGGAALAAAAFAAYPRVQAWQAQDLGFLVGGQVPPAQESLESWLQRRAAVSGARRATLLTESGAFDVSFAELGLTLDAEQTTAQARRSAPSPSLVSRVRGLLQPNPDIRDAPLVWHFDSERAAERLATFAPALARDPSDARLDLSAHARIEDAPGKALDLSASLLEIARGARDDGVVFQIFTRPVPARVTSDMLRTVDVSRVLSSYDTDFTHHAGPRAINIATAARYLNGTVVAPGEVFSFNKTVGARTVQRGFTFAPVIVADELEPGVGGGVCQVASTLHAAAVFGGFDVVQRRSHSRPSGYTPLGLDATVIDGELDLKLKNPYDSPLIIHAFLPTRTTLRIELLGRDPPGKVEHFAEVKEKHEFARRIVVEPGFEPNQSKRHQKGIWGYDVLSTVRTTYPDGERRFRSYTSTYYPVPEVYWVGPGTDPSALPALPEGAQGVELGQAPTSPLQ